MALFSQLAILGAEPLEGEDNMLYWAAVFLIIALIAAILLGMVRARPGVAGARETPLASEPHTRVPRRPSPMIRVTRKTIRKM